MATDQQIKQALQEAAESLMGRKLSFSEQVDLIHRFNQVAGTNRQKALKALKEVTHVDDDELQTKIAESEDVDRKMDDLRAKLDAWKPSS